MPSSVPFMIVAIVAIVTFGRIYSARYGLRRTRGGYEPIVQQDSIESRMLRDEVTALKDRIAVLERLATDNHEANRIDQEIAKLRDR